MLPKKDITGKGSIMESSLQGKRDLALPALPADCKRILLTVLAVGLFAYGFSMFNLLLGQDNSLVWYAELNQPEELFAFATAGRWLANVGLKLFGLVNAPWWSGIWSLLLIGLSAFVTCRTFGIQNKLLQMTLAAVMTACPAIVSSFNYLPSTPSYMLALLSACLAPFFLRKYKYGFVPAFLCLLVTNALYTAYLSVSVCWILLLAVQHLLQKPEDAGPAFVKEIFAALLSLFSLAATLGICKIILLATGISAQNRVAQATAMGVGDYLLRIKSTYLLVLHRLFSNWKSSYMQGIPHLMILAAVVLAILCAGFLCRQAKVWQHPGTLLLLFVNVAFFPLGMDLIGVLQTSHSLMDYAYITPLVASLVLLSTALQQDALPKYRILPLLLVFANLGYALCFVHLGNVAATFRFAQYESAVQLANRVIDRLEAQEGYVAGKTPVLFAGKFPETYFYTDGEWGPMSDGTLAELKNIEGANAWMAFTYQEVLEYISEQVLGTKLYLVQAASVNGGTPFVTDSGELTARVQQIDPSVTETMLTEALEQTPSFPAEDCCVWVEGTLVFKLDFSSAATAAS